MQFLKSALRGFLSLVFKFSLVFLVMFGPLVMVFGTSDQLKESLKTSKLYDNAVTSIIDGAAKDSKEQPDVGSQEESPFSQPAVQEAAKKALTPAFLQNTSEQIIDGMYGWLQSKTPRPEFKIDVSGVKQQFTDAVADYAVTRAKQLPACTLQQTIQLSREKIDPLTVPCVPAGYDIESLRSQVAAQLDKQQNEAGEKDNLLQLSEITPDSLPKDENGKSPVQNFTEDAEKAPEVFHFVTILPWILGVLAVVSGGLVVLLHDEKRRGLRNLALTTLIIGALSLMGIFLTSLVFDKLENSESLVKADANIKGPLTTLVHSLSDAFNHSLLLFGIVYVVLGAGTLTALYFTRSKQTKEHEPTEHEPGSPKAPVTEVSEAQPHTSAEADNVAEKPKKPTKTLIQ